MKEANAVALVRAMVGRADAVWCERRIERPHAEIACGHDHDRHDRKASASFDGDVCREITTSDGGPNTRAEGLQVVAKWRSALRAPAEEHDNATFWHFGDAEVVIGVAPEGYERGESWKLSAKRSSAPSSTPRATATEPPPVLTAASFGTLNAPKIAGEPLSSSPATAEAAFLEGNVFQRAAAYPRARCKTKVGGDGSGSFRCEGKLLDGSGEEEVEAVFVAGALKGMGIQWSQSTVVPRLDPSVLRAAWGTPKTSSPKGATWASTRTGGGEIEAGYDDAGKVKYVKFKRIEASSPASKGGK